MEALKKNHNKIISLKYAKIIVILLASVFVFDLFLFPMPTLAQDAVDNTKINENSAILEDNEAGAAIAEENTNDIAVTSRLPQNSALNVKFSSRRIITAYNSEVSQTDSSPCITANNFNVCEHGIEDTIAANFLHFGAKVKIPELFGDRIFIVRDRMNRRYSDRLDIWMIQKTDAKQFGVKLAKVEVLE